MFVYHGLTSSVGLRVKVGDPGLVLDGVEVLAAHVDDEGVVARRRDDEPVVVVGDPDAATDRWELGADPRQLEDGGGVVDGEEDGRGLGGVAGVVLRGGDIRQELVLVHLVDLKKILLVKPRCFLVPVQRECVPLRARWRAR